MEGGRGRTLHLAALAAVVAYAVYLGWYSAPYASGSDPSGYLNSAQLILTGDTDTPLRLPTGMPPDLLPKDAFVPLGFRLDPSGHALVPTYPVGLPLHLAALGWLTGIEWAARLVGAGSAVAFVVLLYFTARDFGVRPSGSAALAGLAALSPLTLMYALVPMSDLLAAVWALAVVLCCRQAARHAGWAAAGGAALAVAVLVRPTNLLLVLPALVALPFSWRTWLAFGLGGLPGAAFLAWYNHALYGVYVGTGYADLAELFGWKHVLPTLGHYLRWVPTLASPLGLAALALPWLGAPRRDQAVLGTWALAVFGFYAVYQFTHETWWYLRFVLPALPALGIAAALALQALPGRGTAWRSALCAVLVAGAGAWLVRWNVALRATQLEIDNRGYLLAGQWSARELPGDAVLLAFQASGAVMHYSSRAFVVPELLTAADCARLDAWCAANRRPLYAILYPQEEAALQTKFPGRWEKIAALRQAAVWRHQPVASP